MAWYPPQGRIVIKEYLRAYDDNLPWEIVRDAAVSLVDVNKATSAICFPDTYTDKAIQAFVHEDGRVWGRAQDVDNFYWAHIVVPASTADFKLQKYVAGVLSTIATESVDLTPGTMWKIKLECKGTTIKGYREDMTTPKLSVTDTSFTTAGYFGVGDYGSYYNRYLPLVALTTAKLVEPASPSPKVLRFYEVPIIGSGTLEDPFRPKLPEEIVDHPIYGKVNRLALTWSAVIKSSPRTGKPEEYVTLVRILEQPVRQDHLRPIPRCLRTLEALKGVRRLTKDESVRLEKRLL